MPAARTLPLFALLIFGPAVLALALARGPVFEPPWLLLPLSLLFQCALPLAVAGQAVRAYRLTGIAPLLVIGAGMLILGLGGGGSALLLHAGAINPAVALHHCGALLAGIAFLTTSPVGLSAAPLRLRGSRARHAQGVYLGVAFALALLALVVHRDLLPPFVMPGAGFTRLRYLVIGPAILAFALATLAWWADDGPRRFAFVRWYAAGLLLFTFGLFGVLLAGTPGDALSWLGRGGQFAAGVVFLGAAHHAARDRGFASALLHSALAFRPLVESSSEGILVLDRDGILLYGNDAALRLLELHPDAIPGYPLLTLPLPPEAQTEVRGRLASPDADPIELRLATSGGRLFPAELTTCRHPAAAEPLQVWTIRDISLRKQVEEELRTYHEHLEDVIEERTHALQASEERFRLLATSTPDHLFVQDLDLRYTFLVNPQLGLKVEQILGKTDADLLPPPDARRLTEVKRRVIARGEPERFDWTLPNPGAEEQSYEGCYVPKRNSAGEVDGIIGYFRNVTGERRMQQALQASEERFRSLFTTMTEGFALHEVICDTDGRVQDYRFLEANPAFERLTGLGRDRVIGRTVREVLPATDPYWIATYGQVALTGEPVHFERYHAELRRHFEVFAFSPTRRQFAVVFMDITEARQRTLELEAANKELETFAYSVSHDLRAPLRAIDGYVQVLMEDHADRLDAEARQLLRAVSRNAIRMATLIDDMLTFSRLARTTIAPVEVDMQAQVKEVVEELTPADRNLTIHIHALPPARGDASMLRQVWVNLIANAVKFSAPKANARIEIGGETVGAEKVYFVRDNGVGFDMAYAQKLFGVFQRLHAAQEFEGTGIGLAIVDRIIKRHGGQVQATAREGEGAEFRFSLPAHGTAG